MIDIKAAYGHRFKITLDESAEIDGQTREERLWLYQIPGRHGHVYVHGRETLGAYIRLHGDRLDRLLAIPSVRKHQIGDREASATFPPEALEAVAEVLALRRRRQLSDTERRRLVEATAGTRFRPGRKSQNQDLDSTLALSVEESAGSVPGAILEAFP
jgi:hypothetical protein